jgi:hypothetical protein
MPEDHIEEKKRFRYHLDDMIFIRPFKNMAVAILLAFFLGPIGLLYATFLGGVIMAIIIFILLSATLASQSIGPLVVLAWLICPFWAALSCGRQNKKMMRRFDREML